jgi:NAD(P)-dependent dehydrogenase (short-subunit alcohol dehydrogenase family)
MTRIALVTGAGSGIGRAVALAFARSQYRVVLAGRRQEQLEQVAREAGGDALVVPTDVTQPASVAALFSKIRERCGRLDVLFNNAGIGAAAPIESFSLERWRAVIDTNVTGVFLCAQAAYQLMKEQQPRGGRIINNGSIAATTPRPFTIAYTASKHAVSGITKAIALEGRRYDIACGQIDIGNAATELAAPMAKGTVQADLSVRPEPTFEVSHVADAVLYMANLPLEANVLSLTVTATRMPFVGRG